MMPARKTPPEAWVHAAFVALAEGGPDAIRVEALAATMGVTKGGFYREFADRNALIERVLNTWEQAVVDVVITQVEDSADEPRTKLRRLFDLARGYTSETDALSVELAIRDWARRDRGVAQRLSRVDNRRMAYMRTLFRQISADHDDAEARCLLIFSLFVANSFIVADHDGRTRDMVIDAALDKVLA
ncbi:TetR/AcrR family transcriptional regulator [Mycobacterium sp. CBMA226]|nr:TetR/AcrR family transcriptional regulator [Mycolicibacterium sp. CBMA 226]